MNTLFKCFILLLVFNFANCQTVYDVTDTNGLGRRFDGIGGLSGGGPNFGASLQILKVEIGGDDQSTDGTEASHMHDEWEENYNRGYEWWLMEEAKKRNPDIKLWGLPWAWPYWLGSPIDASNPFINITKTAMYITNWILGAKQYHNLTIDYIGIWNEKVCNFDYLMTLRRALDSNQLQHTQIVACDTTYGDFNRMNQNQTVFDAVYAFGVHYPGTVSPTNAIDSNKTLWSSEDYSTYDDDIGAGCWARILNQNYVNGYMTSTTAWNLIASYYFGFPYEGDGLMTAVEPYSGYYEVKNPIWISAHTTQFTKIGWNYLKHGSGVGLLKFGGSYVTLVDPTTKQLTLIIETMSHDHSICIRPSLPPYNVSQQNATFNFGGNFTKLDHLHVWTTALKFDGSPSEPFKYYGTINVTDNSVTLSLDIDCVYTLTTSDQGTHGNFSDIPKPGPFPIPYEDDFKNYQESEEPYYLSPQVGSWEIVKDETGAQIARQTVLRRPVHWCEENFFPVALIGSDYWTDIAITATMRIPSINGTESVFVGLQVKNPGNCRLYESTGIFFHLNKTTSTYQISTEIGGSKVYLAGFLEIQHDTWYTLGLSIKNNQTVIATLNGATIGTTNLPPNLIHAGFAAIGSGSYGYSDIKYLSLTVPTSSCFFPTGIRSMVFACAILLIFLRLC